MSNQPVNKEPLLTPWQLSAKSEYAEFGTLMPQDISKRQIRILTTLYWLQLYFNDDEARYANIHTIQILIELFFDRKYRVDELLYWVYDLGKRGYIALFDSKEKFLEDCLFGLTSLGEDLYVMTYEDSHGRKHFTSEVLQIELIS